MFKALSQLVAASFIAQIISFSVMPFITRLHTPDSLGIYQFFTTVALVITPFITGSLNIAIKKSHSRYQAASYLKLAIQYSLICLVILFCFFPVLYFLLSDGNLGWFLSYIPLLFIFVYLSANFQFAMSFMTNNKNYGNQSTYTLTKSFLSNSLKLIFSIISKSGLGLILALVITEFFQLSRILRKNYRIIFKSLFHFKWKRFNHRLIKIRIYPTYVTTTSVLGILMNWFPILVTGMFYGPTYAGLLGLAFMVVNTPVYPFISALQNVCFGELARDKSPKKLFTVYSKSCLIGLSLSILGLIILYIYGEHIFTIVFGREWKDAGQYAFICFIPISLSLIFSPIYSSLNHFYSFQKTFFNINLITTILGVSITSYLGYKSFDFIWFLWAFSMTMSVSHIVLFLISILLFSMKLKNNRDANNHY